MNRKIATAVVGSLSLLVLAGPAPALAADECLPLTASCANDTISIDPEEVLDDPIGAVVDVVDGAGDTTDPIVDPVVDPVLDVVDDLLNGGGIVEPPGGEGPRDHRSGPGTKVQERDPSSDDARRQVPTAERPTALSRAAFGQPEPIIGSAANGSIPPIAPHGSPGRREGLVEGAVRGLLLLAVLFGITVGFVMVQGRLDRNDPKLIGAPVRTEIVTFA
jgi:hypothetical protein